MARTPATAASATIHQPPSQTRPRTTGAPIAPTTRREISLFISRALTPAEAPAPRRVLLEGGAQLGLAEVGPPAVDEDELGVGELPEQEVRDPELAGGADEEIGIGHLGRVQVRGDELFVDVFRFRPALGDPARRLHDLRATPVVEGDPEVEAVLAGGLGFERGHALPQLLGGAVAAADEACADALLGEVRKLALDRLAEDLHHRLDLGRRPTPVIGRERVDG